MRVGDIHLGGACSPWPFFFLCVVKKKREKTRDVVTSLVIRQKRNVYGDGNVRLRKR